MPNEEVNLIEDFDILAEADGIVLDNYYLQKKPTFELDGFKYYQTCWACPEQYDVIFNDFHVAYVRLRGGRLSVSYPDVGGDIVFRWSFDDQWKGCFDSDTERSCFIAMMTQQLKIYMKLKLQGFKTLKEYTNE